jgi:hypothetical protein
MAGSRATCALAVACAIVAATCTSTAFAQDASPTVEPPAASIDLEKDRPSAALADAPVGRDEAPPAAPYKRSVVIDSSLGAFVFLGRFGQTAPPAPWLRTQVGYELFKWLMVFGEGELGFTDTSGSQAPPRTRAFPLFGFGGGARLTVRLTDRVGVYVQGSLGAMKADIRRRSLEIIGFKDAEDLGLYVGGRIGVEWYQLDRHFALGLTAGLRDATGFKRVGGGNDTPLAFDAGASIRYAF